MSDGSLSQSLTVEIVGNGYPITMKAIFSILLLVLSAAFYPYQWYLIQVPVISVVSIESVLSVGDGFLNQR